MDNKWKKTGNFQILHDRGLMANISPDQEVTYINTIKPNLVSKIKILGLSENGHMQIRISSNSKELFDELENHGFNQKDFILKVAYTTNDHERIIEWLKIINKFEEFDINELLTEIGIRKPEKDLAEEISEFVEKGKFEDAITFAKDFQTRGYNEIIWELAQTLHANRNIDAKSLIDLYKSISEKNPHYFEAQERLGVLYPEIEFEKFPRLELVLDAAIKSKNQKNIDQIFNQLCGHEDLSPVFANMKGDTHTLVTLATHIRILEGKIDSYTKPPEPKYKSFFNK